MSIENLDATVEVDQVNTEQDAPKSMDDTIRETLRSLQSPESNAHDGEVQTDLTPAGAVEDDAAKAARLRDASGKFAANTPIVGEAAPVVGEQPQEQVSQAPNTWKKEAQAAWANADPVIRAEVERREQDFYKGIEQYKNAANFAQTIDRAIAPYAQTFQALGMTPDKAIADIMAGDHKLRYGSPQEKTEFFAQLAHNYGIDLGAVTQHHQAVDPNVYALHSQNQQLQAQLQSFQQTQQQQMDQSLNSEIDAFASDPSHSHFDAVKGHMSALLQAGQARDLADAYEQAIYANPTTRAAVLQQQATAQREEAAKKAQAAKQAASINHRARPSMPVAQPIGSMDDTIRETLRRLQGA